MADPGFLSRWSRLKAESREAPQGAVPAAPAPDPASDAGQQAALPTLEDALRLGPDSDYSAFVARGVDASVRRQALRQLFSDPHFNVIDGLDVYMGDYTKADPIAPAMLASLQHANAWLRSQLEGDNDQQEAAAQPAAAREHDEH